MIEIDGSLGEGGGQMRQMLRTALSLSCVTGKPFHIFNIRRMRPKPGLMRQHQVAVQSAACISSAEVLGDQIGSVELTFLPKAVAPANYDIAIGTAGSTTMVLQTLIPPLLTSHDTSRIALSGGTHVPFSPSWEYLTEIFSPVMARLGARLDFVLDSCGFYPKGGGRVRCRIEPAASFSPLEAVHRGKLLRIVGASAVGNLPITIAERQAHAATLRLREHLGEHLPVAIDIRNLKMPGQGTFIFLKAEYENAVAGFTSLGERGKPAELVGEEAALELIGHHDTGMPVDPHLADQLVLYLAQATGPSRYATSRLTSHLRTNLEVTALFLDFKVEVDGEWEGPGTVTITPRPGARKGSTVQR
ncbi:RNA 3'-terminal phosphate cyclase [Geomonas sp. Red32]|uniref:RNA 3'-terminal phosphate cyclase n=1 Tax=Geomonas sp. Red32 TaxID=2912856 RepID=UPI002545D2F5|nr:RNA 3'-terminal phosphate cyclase [Geomonas sp. Red32]